MRTFILTPSVKSGSTIFSWLLNQHTRLQHSIINENIELGAMLNVLDHIPKWRENLGSNVVGVGEPEMVYRIQRFTDSIINPVGELDCAVKFTNFCCYNWLGHVFPTDRSIIIVRNLYDWYASVKVWNSTRHRIWNRHVVDQFIIRSAQSLEDRSESNIVHFEDLIQNPSDMMASVHRYLGWEEQSISLENQEKIYRSFSSRPDISIIPSNTLINNPIGRQSELTQEDIEHIDTIRNMPIVQNTLYSENRKINL